MLTLNKYLKELGVNKKNYYLFEKTKDKRYKMNKDGLVPAETWSLDYTIILTLYTYISQFKDTIISYPSSLNSMEEWEDILEEILKGFRDYIKYDIADKHDFDKEEDLCNGVKHSLELITKWFFDLWD